MSVNEIVLDPICVLQMSSYYEKHKSSSSLSASYGLIYAQQVELKYRICLSVPLSSEMVEHKELLQRAHEYEQLRLKRSKTTVNFYEEYFLIGCYVMREESSSKYDKKAEELAKVLSGEGANYFMIASPSSPTPKVFQFKENGFTEVRFATEMERNEKICIDSMYHQNSKESSIIKKSIQKQQNMIDVYINKIQLLK